MIPIPAQMEIKDHDEHLYRCPSVVCEAANVFLTHHVVNMDARKHVECRICGIQGPVGTSNEQAARLWNDLPRRAFAFRKPVRNDI